MTRSNKRLNLRPELNLEKTGDKTLEEAFMHDTLRPVLKLQHDHILQLIQAEQHLNAELLMGKQKTRTEKRDYLNAFVRKNNALRNQLIGCIVGMFTLEELDFYLTHRKTLNKRILEMVMTRFLSVFKTN